MIVPVQSYEREFGAFFDGLKHDDEGRVTMLSDVHNITYSIDQFRTDDALHIEVSYDSYRPIGDDPPLRLKIAVLEMIERAGVPELFLSEDEVSRAVIPGWFFNEASLILPAMLRRQVIICRRSKDVRDFMDKQRTATHV